METPATNAHRSCGGKSYLAIVKAVNIAGFIYSVSKTSGTNSSHENQSKCLHKHMSYNVLLCYLATVFLILTTKII